MDGSNEPEFLKAHSDLELDLPEATVARYGVPARMKVRASLEGRSERMIGKPTRVRYEVKADFSVTDLEGKHVYAKNATTLEGESDRKTLDLLMRSIDLLKMASASLEAGLQQAEPAQK